MHRLPDDWVWDSWVADDGERFHLFHLQAPRSLGDPELRHDHARVGHAVSTDLRTWEVLPEALAPRPDGWDDAAIWTGSVVRGDDARWYFFYTALSTRGHGRADQRIGLAVSDDLVTWERVGDEPVVTVDARWYDTEPGDDTASSTWRDPRVVRDPDGEGWHMFVTARARGAERLYDGVLGHAWSPDLLTWEVRPPVSAPGVGFGQLEVPQVELVEGRWVLSFSAHPSEQAPELLAEHGGACLWSVTADHPAGPWDLSRAVPLTADPHLFAAPLVQQRDGTWCFLGFRNHEPEAPAELEVVDPVPVRLEGDGLVPR